MGAARSGDEDALAESRGGSGRQEEQDRFAVLWQDWMVHMLLNHVDDP